MGKNVISAYLGVLALAAFALPAVASAANNPLLTHPTGTAVPVETAGVKTKILATNVTNPILTASDKSTVMLECTRSSMTGELVKNTSGSVEGNITTTTFSGTGPVREGLAECTSPSFWGNFSVDTNLGEGPPWCVRSTSTMAEDEFQVRGGKCTEAAKAITFVLTITSLGTCKYKRASTSPITGEYTTDTAKNNNSDAILHIKDAEFSNEEGGVTCPSLAYFDASYTLETDTTASSDPIWIS
jgi:hypothetical protein